MNINIQTELKVNNIKDLLRVRTFMEINNIDLKDIVNESDQVESRI